jgi:hypothetical protein
MKHTIHLSRVTREEYEFNESEISKALMRYVEIPEFDSRRKRVELELNDEDNTATITLVFAEDEKPVELVEKKT